MKKIYEIFIVGIRGEVGIRGDVITFTITHDGIEINKSYFDTLEEAYEEMMEEYFCHFGVSYRGQMFL